MGQIDELKKRLEDLEKKVFGKSKGNDEKKDKRKDKE